MNVIVVFRNGFQFQLFTDVSSVSFLPKHMLMGVGSLQHTLLVHADLANGAEQLFTRCSRFQSQVIS